MSDPQIAIYGSSFQNTHQDRDISGFVQRCVSLPGTQQKGTRTAGGYLIQKARVMPAHGSYVSLSDNVESAYKARELKSVHLDAEACFIKLSLHKCYVNALNLYNQVGLVAVNVLGNVIDSDYLLKKLAMQRPVFGMTIGTRERPCQGCFARDHGSPQH